MCCGKWFIVGEFYQRVAAIGVTNFKLNSYNE